MSQLIDMIRFIFISPEILVGLVLYTLLTNFPELVTFLTKFIFDTEINLSNSLILFGIPLTSLTISYKLTENILNPDDKSNRKILKEWPNYWMLKNRLYYSMILSILSLFGCLASWYYALNNNIESGTIYIIIFWSLSLTSLCTVANAKLKIKDLLY